MTAVDKSATIVIVIEGNIGVGKSTLLSNFAGRNNGKKIKIIKEPLKMLSQSLNRIESACNDAEKAFASFSMQQQVLSYYQQKCKEIMELKKQNYFDIILIERSPQATMVFSAILKQNGFISAALYKLLEKQYNEIFFQVDMRILLLLSPEQCRARITSRGRQFEQALTISYLKQLDVGFRAMVSDLYSSEYVTSIGADKEEEQVVDRLEKEIIYFHKQRLLSK